LHSNGFFANYKQTENRKETDISKKQNPLLRLLIKLGIIFIGVFLPVVGVILYAFIRPHDQHLGKVTGISAIVGAILNICLYMFLVFASGM